MRPVIGGRAMDMARLYSSPRIGDERRRRAARACMAVPAFCAHAGVAPWLGTTPITTGTVWPPPDVWRSFPVSAVAR